MLSEEEIKRGKELLQDYYDKFAIVNTLPDIEDRLHKLKIIAEDLVDYITDIIYNE